MHLNAKHRCSDAQKRSHSHIDWVISISLSCCLVWASLWALELLHMWFLCFSFSAVVTMKELCFSIQRHPCRFYHHAILFFSPGLSFSNVRPLSILPAIILHISILPLSPSSPYLPSSCVCSAIVQVCVRCKSLWAKSKHLHLTPAESLLHLLKWKAEPLRPRLSFSMKS